MLCDEQTRFAAITLTHGGKWHSIPALEVLLNCLRSGGITATNLYRESGSEDWLLLAFFDQAVSTDLLQKSLCTLFSRVQIDPEGLKVHSEAERLILPLQPGFAWLHKNGDVLRTREELSLDQALEFFLLDMENGFNSWSDFSQTIAYPANLHVHEVQNSSEETPQIALADGKTRSTTESESVPVSVSPSLSEASLDFSPIPIIEPGPKPVQLKLFDSTSERAPP